jgi:uncharacterized membrane protein
VAILFRKYPPNNINAVYGYKTTASMKDKESWKKANEYSSKLLLIIALVFLLFQLIISKTLGISERSIFVSATFLLTSFPLLIVLTENHLKKG